MKTIGLIGGTSWESTAIYYSLINREVQRRLGGFHSAKIVLFSVDFAELEILARTSQWDELAVRLCDAAQALERAGADMVLLCANTMHHDAGRVAKSVALPLLHICDCTAAEIKAQGLKRVALLGTAYTMNEDFYKDRLRANGLEGIRKAYKGKVCANVDLDRQTRQLLEPVFADQTGIISGAAGRDR